MTFSIIVPVYNVEKYLSKCLDSILNQSFQDFEIIVVNDGSPDNSQDIIDEYAKNYPEKIKPFIKENGGLSDARNFGIQRAQGEYLFFVDSDDYLNTEALQRINSEIEDGRPDIIGVNLVTVNEKDERIGLIAKPQLSQVSGEEAIIALVDSKEYFEPAVGFVYRTEYWKSSGYEFMKGIYHEDYALIPLVILRAQKVSCLNLEAYYYVSTDNSITRTQTEERRRRLAFDLLKGYDFLVDGFYKTKLSNEYAGKMYLAYVSNAVIYRLQSLSGELKRNFRKEVRKRKVSRYIIEDSLKRKLRKLIIKLKNGI